ncbi:MULTISPECIES: ABC transporter ATP-binding protein [Arthrobacter]|uniref:ABC transporter ATP-binding protein n=1 Tax=Arthrobacter terricola TaxID=2547396 RepID=A0A4R5KCB4_9MICC|nr:MULTISPECIES: ATP-binding cassette domain-containing protein [Arthrobacter]MBT8162281.1 ATP-binding cassette domain-containing protein [Arthrobacter sp. GN70]TDF92245.1 ABC transporter ATP-binding protein [Arthrobacter terricola]
MANIIEVAGLNKTFRMSSKHEPVRALDDVAVSVREGSCMAVVGESGSGKTTLARVLVGLETKDSGEVAIGGNPVTASLKRKEQRSRARAIQMVFQDPNGSLNRRLPVGSAVDEVLRAHFPLTAVQRRERVAELFASVGLNEGHAQSLPSALSGGQKQRVAIARAFAAEPKIIVLDEAVSALDVSVQAQVLELLHELRRDKGLTYLFITHDLSVVRNIADDVIVMRRGQVLERGPVGDVLDRPLTAYTRLLLECAPKPGWKPRRGVIEHLNSEIAS